MLSKNVKCKKQLKIVLILTVMLTLVILFVLANVVMAAGTLTIDTIVGSDAEAYLGDGGQATDAAFNDIYDFVFDSDGNMYLTDTENNVIRKVDTSGVVTTIAGDGTQGYSGDGGPATFAKLYKPGAIIIDDSDNLYFSDTYNNVIRKIDTSGIITTIVGDNVIGGSFFGDGVHANHAGLSLPYGLCFDNQGNLLFADLRNNRIRKVDMTTGIITTIAGNGTTIYEEDQFAVNTGIQASDVIVDSDDNIYIAGNDLNRVLKIDAATGIITTYAGNGIGASTFGLAIFSSINRPWGLCFDADENMYIVERRGFVVTKIDKGTKILSRVAGTGFNGFAGDGGTPLGAEFCYPTNVYVDNNGTIYVADKTNNRIREIATYYTATYAVGAHGTITGETSQTIKTNSDATEVVAVPDSGCVFVQWSDGLKTASRIDTNVTSDINVTAQFDFEYTITLNEQGGNAVDDITKVNNSVIDTAPSIIRIGYVFEGWYEESTYDTAVEFPYTIVGNDTWYAKWTKKPTPASTQTATSTPTQTATSTPTPTQSNSASIATQAAETATPTLTPTLTSGSGDTMESEEMITSITVLEDKDAETVTVTVSVSDLPEGTTAIELPNGKIVELSDLGTVEITVSKDALSEKGTFNIIALDDEGTPISSCVVQVLGEFFENPSDNEGNGDSFLYALLWIFGGAVVIGVIAIYLILKKRKSSV